MTLDIYFSGAMALGYFSGIFPEQETEAGAGTDSAWRMWWTPVTEAGQVRWTRSVSWTLRGN
jgi:hypothetical protein